MGRDRTEHGPSCHLGEESSTKFPGFTDSKVRVRTLISSQSAGCGGSLAVLRGRHGKPALRGAEKAALVPETQRIGNRGKR